MAWQKSTVTLVLLLALTLGGCGGEEPAAETTQDAPAVRAFVTILPQEQFVERVGGQHVSVQALVKPGQNPHMFEPSPRQMADLARADVYFLVGVPFEQIIRDRVQAVGADMRMVDIGAGIRLRTMEAHDHDHDHNHEQGDEHGEHGADHGHHEGGGLKDPHTWLAPDNVKIMARNIADALIEIDPDHADAYRRNLEALLKELDQLDAELERITSGMAPREFMVYHPAFGYFADAYGLEQVPIEIEGKAPSARELSRIIQRARQRGVRVIFVQKQFSDKSARVVAEEIGGKVVALDPLARDYMSSMRRIAQAFAESGQ